jgi:hypothetical protein
LFHDVQVYTAEQKWWPKPLLNFCDSVYNKELNPDFFRPFAKQLQIVLILFANCDRQERDADQDLFTAIFCSVLPVCADAQRIEMSTMCH